MKKFNYELILQKNTVVHCKTVNQAFKLLEWANSVGLKWSTGCSYLESNDWYEYAKQTCYYLDEGTFGTIEFYKEEEYKILSFEEATREEKEETMQSNPITIVHDGVELTLTQEQVALLNKSRAGKQFDIKYKEKAFYTNQGKIHTSAYPEINCLSHGTVRQTIQLALIASNNQRKRNKLEELVHWLEPDWRHKETDRYYYFIAYSKSHNRFFISKNANTYMGMVTMSEQTADTIVEELNNGLLPELFELLSKD